MNLTETTAYTDRDGIVDAVTRIVEGIDFGDEDLLRSAFTEDTVFDLSGIDHSIHAFEPYVGRDVVVTGRLRSGVFGKTFRLVRRTGALSHPNYALEVR